MRTRIGGLLIAAALGGAIAHAGPAGKSDEKQTIAAPEDVAAPPADAQRTKSGIAYKVLVPGKGGDRPNEWDSVEVHYTGWTTDGKMFDSSRTRGRTATFALKKVIPGWTEALQLMSVGEQTRIWIPEELAYKGKEGRPQGTLVFDVELVSITPGPKPVPPPANVAAPPKKAKKTKSGIAYVVLAKGDKKKLKPKATDWVAFKYTTWTTDGKMVDSSTVNKQAAVTTIEGAKVKGVAELLGDMTRGEKRCAWLPAELADDGSGNVTDMRVYEIEIVDIIDLAAPADVAASPSDGETTASGLTTKVLRKGVGTDHPTAMSTVEVHYTGWTTDGKMFDSSYTRSSTIKFRLDRVIPGWTEGVQLMTVGEKRRLWIPEELAYKGRAGAPQGTLVFDVELISFTNTP